MEEDMELVPIVDVPDTPDRSNVRNNDRKCVGNPENRERAFPIAGEMSNCSKYIILSPDKPNHSQKSSIFRRAQTEKVFGLGTSRSSGAEKMEKGKTVSSMIPSKSSHHQGIPVFDLTEENGQLPQPKQAFLHRGSRDNTIEDKKELKASIGNSSLPSITDYSNKSRNAATGKCKLDNKTLPGPHLFMDRGKSISLSNDSQSQSKGEKQVSLPPRFSTAPGGRGHKRLVRNGCISPQNIATRAKQSAEQSSSETNNVEQICTGPSASSNIISPISVDDIVAEDRVHGRVKGKGLLIHPSSHGANAGTIHIDSSPVVNYEEASGSRNKPRNSFENRETQGGWRTTHNDQHLYGVDGHHSRNNYNGERFVHKCNMNRLDRSDTGSSQNGKHISVSLSDHTPQPASLINPDVGQSARPSITADSLTKRQRKPESSFRNPNVASHNSGTIVVNSSGESSSSSSRVLAPEFVELLSIPSFTNGLNEGVNHNDNNSSVARAMQLEADEILARELQEQLYNDDYFESSWIDEHLARELQDAGDLLPTSTDNHQIPHPTRISRGNRQPRFRPHQNPSNRRAFPQVPLSNRASQTRSRMTTRSSRPTVSSRGRRPRFPIDMDLDMRLDILEALEDAVGDFNDMGMADNILNGHRDFNEDDYEMLLALDDQNHQHTGASTNLINSLPQSTVQNDNFTENCAICIETPVKGDIIRHLPCLHKFHKDCIDPWLGRKRLCPVCKSSIT
ncbi:unnamed protein product [Lathyrus oleraceus]|uniref:RING-type domain-containing protein n=2 Tax=Pisum sativum TaxID=3888 RepID=A0A9D4W568_PEA|nr:uncharacterized protein LOC127091337 isoform X2 [Pisum sativum]KAI5394615.1 hypothetical protein KIW84_061307 [Pisum sativum]